MKNIQSYIASRFVPRLKYYEKRARSYKRINQIIRIASSLSSLGMLVLLNVSNSPRFVISGIAALLAFLVNLENIVQFDSLWKSYRFTKQNLETELFLYSHKAGLYALPERNIDSLFVERSEDIMKFEAQQWFSSMTGKKERPLKGAYPPNE